MKQHKPGINQGQAKKLPSYGATRKMLSLKYKTRFTHFHSRYTVVIKQAHTMMMSQHGHGSVEFKVTTKVKFLLCRRLKTLFQMIVYKSS